MRKHGRTDASHAHYRDLFRAHGCEWQDTSNVGGGFPDAIATWRRVDFPAGFGRRTSRIALIEIKETDGDLTTLQGKFHKRFHVWIVRTDQDAAEVVRWLKS